MRAIKYTRFFKIKKYSFDINNELKAYKESMDPLKKFKIGEKIGDFLFTQEDFENAYKIYTDLHDIVLNLNKEDDMINILYRLTESAYNIDKKSKIEIHVQTLLNLAKKNQNTQIILYSSIKYIELLLNNNQLDQAEELINEIKDIPKENRELAQMNFFIGVLKLKRKEFDISRDYFNLVLQYAEQNNKTILYVEVLLKLSIIESNYNLEKALILAEKSFKLSELMKNDQLIEKSFDYIRYITIALFKQDLEKAKKESENNNLELAKNHYKNAIRISSTFKDSSDSYENIIFNYCSFLTEKTHEYEEAFNFLNEIEIIAKDKDSKEFLKDIRLLKYKIFCDQKNYEKATEIFQIIYPEITIETCKIYAKHCERFKDFKKAQNWLDQMLILAIENENPKAEKEALQEMRNLKKLY